MLFAYILLVPLSGSDTRWRFCCFSISLLYQWTKYHHCSLSKSGFWSGQRVVIDYLPDLLDIIYQFWTTTCVASFFFLSPKDEVYLLCFIFSIFSSLPPFSFTFFFLSFFLLDQLDTVHIGIVGKQPMPLF